MIILADQRGKADDRIIWNIRIEMERKLGIH